MNTLKDLLCELGLSSEESIVPFYPKVRDRDDVSVLKCLKSGILFLSRQDHMEISHYEEKKFFRYWGVLDRKAALASSNEDAQRRFSQFKNVITNKKWVDIGTGAGGILDLLSPFAAESLSVEPQENARKSLTDLGYSVFASIDDIQRDDLEVATMFHVLEHLTTPIDTLASIRKKMAPGGKLIVEVPHARDFLISFFDSEPFKAHTFWSEHLILHTRESLRTFLEKAGFKDVSITGFQRYPLANHLHWLAKGERGGHIVWDQLRTPELDVAYGNMLAQLDVTDTLIAVARS